MLQGIYVMRVLIDTHTYIWFAHGSRKISTKARDIISNYDNKIFISSASIWEMAIKYSLGKLQLQKPFHRIIEDLNFNYIEILPINFEHSLKVTKLDFIHKDPFDRILVAQSMIENMPIISKDIMLDKYGITRIW
jgi:PIN domain nuclease of toxin-antitoxin system